MASKREIQIAADIARTSTLPLDRLPYTEEFERLYLLFKQTLRHEISRIEFWHNLLSARKRGMVGAKCRRRRRE